MKLKTLLGVPVLLAVVGYAALKGYIYVKVEHHLTELSRAISPFAVFTHEGVASDLRGSVTVTGVRLTPVGTSLSFLAQEVELDGPDVEFLLGLSRGFKGKEPPRYAYLKFRRIDMPKNSEILRQFRQLSLPPQQRAKFEMAPPCTLAGILQHNNLDALGYGRLIGDISIGYKRYPQEGIMEITSEYGIDGLESMEIRAVLKGVLSVGQVMRGTLPSLDRVEIDYHPARAYMEGIVKHCAEQASQTPQDFVEHLFMQSESDFAETLGFAPGEGIREGLKRIIGKASEVHVSAYPHGVITTQLINSYHPKDLLSLWGVQVTVDGKPIEDLTFTTAAELAKSVREVTADQAENPGASVGKRYLKRFMETPISQLNDFIGKRVKLHLKGSDRIQEGILDTIENGEASVLQHIYGGKFTVYVSLGDIRRVEVLRRIEVKGG